MTHNIRPFALLIGFLLLSHALPVWAHGEEGAAVRFTNDTTLTIAFGIGIVFAVSHVLGTRLVSKRSVPMIEPVIAFLVGVVAMIHIIIGVNDTLPLFVLNGIGFIALFGLRYDRFPSLDRDRLRPMAHVALMAFTALTFVLFFAYHPSVDEIVHEGILGLVSKAAELLILLGLWQSRPNRDQSFAFKAGSA